MDLLNVLIEYGNTNDEADKVSKAILPTRQGSEMLAELNASVKYMLSILQSVL